MYQMLKKYLNVILTIGVTILLGICILLFVQQKQLKREIAMGQSIISDQDTQFHLLNHLFELDALLLNFQNLDSLKEHYVFLQSDNESEMYKNRINDRISFIKNYAQSNQAESVAIIQLKSRLNSQEKRIESLNSSLASAYTENKQTIDELNARLKKQNELLVNQKTEISKKEKIQIITFNSTKNIVVHYMGEVVQGKANGNGMGIWATGSKYQGEWLNNERHGKGTYQWSDGDKYEGDYLHDMRSGFGIYHFKTGERYEGEWSNDKRNGEGTLFDKDSNVRFKGIWVDDKPQVK